MAQTRRINIVLNTTQAQAQLAQLNGQLGQTQTQGQGAGTSASRLSKIIGRAGLVASAGLAVKSLVELGESFQRTNTQIKGVTSSVEEFNEVQQSLIGISLETGTSLEANAQVFQRLTNALQTSGKTTFEVLEVTDTLNKAFALSGVNGVEASAALTQLSQAFASGVLRGDEFNSIAEQAPILLRLISQSSGIAESSLRELASEGKLTSEVVFKALTENGAEIDRQFSDLPDTFGKLGNTISTVAKTGVGSLNEQMGVLIGKLFDTNEGAVSLTAIVAGGFNKAVEDLARRAGLIDDNVAATNKFVELNRELNELEEQYNKLKESGSLISRAAIVDIGKQILAKREEIELFIEERRIKAEERAKAQEDAEIAAKRRKEEEERKKNSQALLSASQALVALQKAFNESASSGDRVIDSINKKYDERIEKLTEIREKQLASVTDEQKSLEIQNGITKEIEKQNEARQSAIDLRQKEIDAENAAQLAKLQEGVTSSSGDLSSAISGINPDNEESEFEKLQERNERALEIQAEQQAAELALLQEKREQELVSDEEFQERKTQILNDGEEARKRIVQATEDAKLAITANSFKTAIGALATFSKKAFKINQAVGIAEASISIAKGIAKAQELGFPLNIAESARVAAVGIAQIRQIKSQSFSGGSGGVSTGGGGGSSASPESALSSQRTVAPTRDIVTSRTSEQGQLIEELRRVDSEVLPTSFVRKMAASLIEIQEESGRPTGGFED